MANSKRPFSIVASRRVIQEFPRLIPVEGNPATSYNFFKSLEDNIHNVDIPFMMLLANAGMVNWIYNK